MSCEQRAELFVVESNTVCVVVAWRKAASVSQKGGHGGVLSPRVMLCYPWVACEVWREWERDVPIMTGTSARKGGPFAVNDCKQWMESMRGMHARLLA